MYQNTYKTTREFGTLQNPKSAKIKTKKLKQIEQNKTVHIHIKIQAVSLQNPLASQIWPKTRKFFHAVFVSKAKPYMI